MESRKGFFATQIILFGILIGAIGHVADAKDSMATETVAVTILATNLADGGTVGEWGFSALVEVDGRCILFDAGNFPDTVLRNAKVLDVDLSCVTDVVLSHFHADHTTGLIPLLKDLRSRNSNAMRRIHVADGFFLSRRNPSATGDTERNKMIAMRKVLEALVEQHRVFFDGNFVTANIYDRDLLVAGHRVAGPAVITQTDSTTLIHPGHAGEVDAYLNILIYPEGGRPKGSSAKGSIT